MCISVLVQTAAGTAILFVEVCLLWSSGALVGGEEGLMGPGGEREEGEGLEGEGGMPTEEEVGVHRNIWEEEQVVDAVQR